MKKLYPWLVPSMVDGLKRGQRKILFCAFNLNNEKDIEVAEFSRYVIQESKYLRGDHTRTIIGMAQDFLGTNNINLLQPNGLFGTHYLGGKDHDTPYFIYTRLSPIARCLFPEEDDILVDYRIKDGKSIEPMWYMPIIPMVLINGNEGVVTSNHSYVLKYNPWDVVSNVRRLLNDEPMEPMHPWYKDFAGTVDRIAAGVYTISGMIEEVSSTKLRITELPIGVSTRDYIGFLESMMTGNDPFIRDYKECSNGHTTVCFEVILSEENLILARIEGLLKTFRLTTKTINTRNKLSNGNCIKKFDSPLQILEEFYTIRIEFYKKRKVAMEENFEREMLKLDNKLRLISEVGKGNFNLFAADLLVKLKAHGFETFSKNTKTPGAEDSIEDFEYLLSMEAWQFTNDGVGYFKDRRDMLKGKFDNVKDKTPKSLWMTDLDRFEKLLEIVSPKKSSKKHLLDKDFVLAKPPEATTDMEISSDLDKDFDLSKPPAATSKRRPAKQSRISFPVKKVGEKRGRPQKTEEGR